MENFNKQIDKIINILLENDSRKIKFKIITLNDDGFFEDKQLIQLIIYLDPVDRNYLSKNRKQIIFNDAIVLNNELFKETNIAKNLISFFEYLKNEACKKSGREDLIILSYRDTSNAECIRLISEKNEGGSKDNDFVNIANGYAIWLSTVSEKDAEFRSIKFVNNDNGTKPVKIRITTRNDSTFELDFEAIHDLVANTAFYEKIIEEESRLRKEAERLNLILNTFSSTLTDSEKLLLETSNFKANNNNFIRLQGGFCIVNSPGEDTEKSVLG